MKTIFSGVQPTGSLHLGNLYGAVKGFAQLQNDNECYFCIADQHAITLPHDPYELRNHVRKTAATYLACGIDPNKAVIFQQSNVSAHSEMAWMLNCVARMGWMERMHQYQTKSGENKERSSIGLFSYPVLMAGDILLYGTTHVPVGDDQNQHINLTKDIAEKFNHDFNGDLVIPQAIKSSGSKIMSLFDGSKKMSKSDPNEKATIFLTDTDDDIVRKIKRATTDSLMFPESAEDVRIEIDNLITIYMNATGVSRDDVYREFGGKGYGGFKKALTDVVVGEVSPIREEIMRHLGDQANLSVILRGGAERAREKAQVKLDHVKHQMGLT